MPILSITSRFFAYDDSGATNNPEQRSFDWTRKLQGIPVENPATDPHRVAPLQSATLFTGVRTLTADGTTRYDLTVSPLAANRYRLKWDGTGTTPGFRTARAINFAAGTVTVTPQLNQSVVVTASAGSIFGAVQDGDTVFIPGVSTGDAAGPFDTLNEGFWFVLSAAADQLALARFPGIVYSAKGETVTVAANTAVQAFSSTGVLLDDILKLSSAFPVALRQTYEIVAITDSFIEFLSGTTLAPLNNTVPGATAVTVYSNAKSWLYLETDQNVGISINGGASFDVEPLIAGDPAKIGHFELMGSIYSLTVTNNSTQTATIRILSAE